MFLLLLLCMRGAGSVLPVLCTVHVLPRLEHVVPLVRRIFPSGMWRLGKVGEAIGPVRSSSSMRGTAVVVRALP